MSFLNVLEVTGIKETWSVTKVIVPTGILAQEKQQHV